MERLRGRSWPRRLLGRRDQRDGVAGHGGDVLGPGLPRNELLHAELEDAGHEDRVRLVADDALELRDAAHVRLERFEQRLSRPRAWQTGPGAAPSRLEHGLRLVQRC